MLECKKCYISNHESTAVGLTFVLFGKSPKLETSAGWIEAGWQVDFLRVLLSWFFLVDSSDIVDTERFWNQQFKNITLQNPSLFHYATNFCPHLRKESTTYFTLYLIKYFNSTMEQQRTE